MAEVNTCNAHAVEFCEENIVVTEFEDEERSEGLLSTDSKADGTGAPGSEAGAGRYTMQRGADGQSGMDTGQQAKPTGYCMTCQNYPTIRCVKYHNVVLANRFLDSVDSLTPDNIFSRRADSVELPSEQSMETNGSNSGIPRCWDNIRAQHVGDSVISLDRDQRECNITGSAVLSDENLAMVDYNNSNLKLLDVQKNEICAVLALGARPWDVIEVCTGHLAITLIDQQKILFVQVGRLLVRGREIRVRGFCTGIDMYREKNFVVSFMYPGKVEIMDMQGRVLRIFKWNRKGGEFFSGPQYVTVCPFTHAIYVSDCIRHRVIQLRADGKVLREYHGDELQGPVKLLVPKPGVVFVCGFESRNVLVLTQDLVKFQGLPLNIGVKENPYSLSYCEESGRLYVTLASQNVIIVYQLS